MPKKAIQISFFAVITAGVSVLLFFILKPYLGVIFVAGVFSVVFYPVYKKFLAKFKGKKELASLTTTFLILIFIIVPLIVLSALLLKEAVDLYNSIAFGGGSLFISQVGGLLNKAASYFPQEFAGQQINVEMYARNILNWVIGHFGSIFSVVFGGMFKFILMLISLYYMFIGAEVIKKNLLSWSPLPDEHDEQFIETLKLSIDAVLKGRILVAAVQGVFIGIGFALFGVGSPVLWGFIGAVASLIPMLGTSIVTIPAIAYLFIIGNYWQGLGLFAWSVLAVGLIDNFISVVFLKNKIQIHPLVVLFSILGAVEIFGAVGFLVGPIVVSALVALIKIYPFLTSYGNQP